MEYIECPNVKNIFGTPAPENEQNTAKGQDAEIPVIPPPEELDSQPIEDCDPRPSFTRKRQRGRREKKSLKKSIQRNPSQLATDGNDITFITEDESKNTEIDNQTDASHADVEEELCEALLRRSTKNTKDEHTK